MSMYLLAHTCHPFCVAVSMIIPEISSLYDNEKLVSSFFFFKSPLGALVQIFGESCSADKAVLKMDSSQKEYIVKLHNRMRNRIAMGEIKKYSSAAKMPCFVSNLFEQILIEKLFKIWCESNLNAK